MARVSRGRGRTQQTWAGIALVALFVLTQAWVTLHHATVEHHRCPVDGALAHGSHAGHADGHGLHAHGADGHGSSEHRSLENGESDPHEGELLLTAAEAADEHDEHCSLPTWRDERRGWSSSPVVSDARALTQLPGLTVDRAPRASAIPLFRLAPKQSPPGIA